MSFVRRERDGVIRYSGRDHNTGLGWWIIMALVGGGAAFIALDPVGPALTVGFIVAAIVLGLLGQLTALY